MPSPISTLSHIGDRVLVDAQLVSTKQVGTEEGLFFYMVKVRGTSKPIPVLEEDLYDYAEPGRMRDIDYDQGPKNIGTNIRRFRRRMDMTQRELSGMIGFSTGTIGNWELGISYPQTKDIAKVADVLGVTVDDLLRVDDLLSEEAKDERSGT